MNPSPHISPQVDRDRRDVRIPSTPLGDLRLDTQASQGLRVIHPTVSSDRRPLVKSQARNSVGRVSTTPGNRAQKDYLGPTEELGVDPSKIPPTLAAVAGWPPLLGGAPLQVRNESFYCNKLTTPTVGIHHN